MLRSPLCPGLSPWPLPTLLCHWGSCRTPRAWVPCRGGPGPEGRQAVGPGGLGCLGSSSGLSLRSWLGSEFRGGLTESLSQEGNTWSWRALGDASYDSLSPLTPAGQATVTSYLDEGRNLRSALGGSRLNLGSGFGTQLCLMLCSPILSAVLPFLEPAMGSWPQGLCTCLIFYLGCFSSSLRILPTCSSGVNSCLIFRGPPWVP